MLIFDDKIKKFFVKTRIILVLIIASSFLIKIYYTPFGIPLIGDAFAYFQFAIDFSILLDYPDKIMPNDGWPLFLGIFFSLFKSTNYMDFMDLQRLISIVISILTIIPIYFIAKKFVNTNYSLVASLIFAFEPRILENSISGLSESLYILVSVLSINFFINNKNKTIYLAFGLSSLLSLIRTEGIFLFLSLAFAFIIKKKISKEIIKIFLISNLVFFSIIIPFLIVRKIKTGYDHLIDRMEIYSNNLAISTITNDSLLENFYDGILNYVKFLGWDLIPIFFIFSPLGFFLILKKRKWENDILLIFSIFISVPIFFIYILGVEDSRYFYILYPIFCIYFAIGAKKIIKNNKYEKVILLILILFIISCSLLFIEYRKIDQQHEREALMISKVILNKTIVINEFWPESGYIPTLIISDKESFPRLISEFNLNPKIISIKTENLDEYMKIGKENGLTHFIIDDKKNNSYRMKFLGDIFDNEDNYPFLEKQYDSLDDNFTYHVKIFKINYGVYENMLKKD